MRLLWLRFYVWIVHLYRWPASRRVKPSGYSEEEKRALIAALAEHPGWKLLMADLENYRAGFEAMQQQKTRRIPLKANAEETIRQIIRIDEGITWIGWLQWRIKRAGAAPQFEAEEPPERIHF